MLYTGAVPSPSVEISSAPLFDELLSKELQKAKRYGRRLAIVSLRRREGVGAPLASLAGEVLETLRGADAATLLDEELLVLLPETDRLGALFLQERVASSPAGMRLQSGAAAFPEDGREIEALLGVARGRGREEGRSPFVAAGLPRQDFWGAVEALVDGGRGVDASYRGPLGQRLFLAGQAEAIRELSRGSTHRGVLVVCSAGGAALADPSWELLPPGPSPSSVFQGGRREEASLCHPAATAVALEGDPRAERFDVLLALFGHGAYGMVRAREAGVGLHTADVPLVRRLVAIFREAHGLLERKVSG